MGSIYVSDAVTAELRRCHVVHRGQRHVRGRHVVIVHLVGVMVLLSLHGGLILTVRTPVAKKDWLIILRHFVVHYLSGIRRHRQT